MRTTTNPKPKPDTGRAGLGIYVLNLCIGFLSPAGDPGTDGSRECCICIYAHACILTYVYMHTCACVYIRLRESVAPVCMHIRTSLHTCRCIHTHTVHMSVLSASMWCMCLCACVCACVYVHACACVCVHVVDMRMCAAQGPSSTKRNNLSPRRNM